MTDRKEIYAKIERCKLVAIARKIPADKIVPAVQAAFDGGIRLVEITFNQEKDGMEETCDSIRRVREAFGDDVCVGAGTVMNVEQLQAAGQAGAEFILAPNTDEAVIRRAVEYGILAVPGAVTPTEIANAYAYGAAIVKVFPAGNLGPGYIGSVRGPMPHIPLMAVGGVSADNVAALLRSGCMSAGIGSHIMNLQTILSGDYSKITKAAAQFVREAERLA